MHLAPGALIRAQELPPLSPFLFSLVASEVPNLLHLGVVRRRNAIEVGGDLRAQVLTQENKVQSGTMQKSYLHGILHVQGTLMQMKVFRMFFGMTYV